MEYGKQLTVATTDIPGLLLLDLPVHGDNRGWFKENWQREKMTAAGLPDLGPVQNNVSFNANRGTTRGIHAEPWDKYVSVATGRIFGAWVDLREGEGFGRVVTAEIDPSRAVFVPNGVGNAFQTLQDGTAYVYLVNDHWSAEAQSRYTFLNLADEASGIAWPIPLETAELSAKDREHPRLADVTPMSRRRVLVTGANGQLGRALRARVDALEAIGPVDFVGSSEFDIADPAAYTDRRWQDYAVVVNAAAYTRVDEAETPQGRRDAWRVNVEGVRLLAETSRAHGIRLVHVSSDYVFDGSAETHAEDEPFSPLGVYGQTKAAGDALAATVPAHLVLRTSWVIGDGGNFVATMRSLAERGVDPSVVDDQIGRLTFTDDLADALVHLLVTDAESGVYNVSNSGEPLSWAGIAARVFALTGHDAQRVSGVGTAEYFAGKAAAPRPLNSTLDLGRLEASGFHTRDQLVALESYLS